MLKPYLGGEDLNTSPLIAAPRFVVDSDGVSAGQMATMPRVLAFLQSRLREDLLGRGAISENTAEWWRFRRPSLEYRRACRQYARVLAISEVTSHFSFAFVPTAFVPAHTLKLFGFDSFDAFAVLQSRPHEIWARFFGSSMKDDLRYTPTDCFETFPFPENWETHSAVEATGKAYYEFRAALMVRNNEGLTKTYNRFHDADERDPEILKLRELHATMDRAVLDAYGWSDIPTDCEFLLDYEIDEEAWGDKKKPYRYRWPDEVRDEVLARLLELNAERAKAEARSGATATKKRGKKAAVQRAPKEPDTGDLFS